MLQSEELKKKKKRKERKEEYEKEINKIKNDVEQRLLIIENEYEQISNNSVIQKM